MVGNHKKNLVALGHRYFKLLFRHRTSCKWSRHGAATW